MSIHVLNIDRINLNADRRNALGRRDRINPTIALRSEADRPKCTNSRPRLVSPYSINRNPNSNALLFRMKTVRH